LLQTQHYQKGVFLLNKLGYDWDYIHDIAEKLEHIGDNNLTNQLEKFLGFPEYDPYGNSIPNDKTTILSSKKLKSLVIMIC
jgi:DtxR family Mn-dependent transcriptional regulator